MEGKKVLSTLKPYEQGMQTEAVKKKFNLEKIVKLASNENPFGYSPEVKQYLQESTPDLSIYPDGHASELRALLAKELSVSEDSLVFSAGLDEMIQVIARCYLETGKNTVMAVPTFPQYKHQALLEGAEIREVAIAEDGAHDLDKMLAAIDSQTAIVWICSPNNPTGTVTSKEAFIAFMDQCPSDVLVVLDEAYYEFVNKNLDMGAIRLLSEYKNLLVLRTFSKAYGLAGLRIGYGVGDTAITTKLNIARGPFNTSSIAQKAAVLALEDKQFLTEVAAKNSTIRKGFEAFLDELGWGYKASETNFLLVDTPIDDDLAFFQMLLEKGFIVRPGAKVGYPGTMRVTIGEAADMEILKDVLRKLDNQVKQ